MKLGAQLYTVRNEMKTPEQIKAGLEKIAKIGYSCVQVSGIGKIDCKELRGICDSLDLEIAVTHIPTDSVIGNTEKVIADHDIMGCDYIGIGSLPKQYRTAQGVGEFYDNYIGAITKINAAGKKFTLHNHHYEFAKFNGELLLDTIAKTFSPEQLMFTLDCYWVNYGGADVCDTIDKLSGRIDCVHLKDYAIDVDAIVMAPVMSGNMNYPKIIEHLEKAGTKYALVEQDSCYGRDPFECLEESYNNLKKYF